MALNNRVHDVQIDSRGSIWLIRPLSLRGNRWINDHVESASWQWLGGALCIDHRYAAAILRAMKRARLKVQ